MINKANIIKNRMISKISAISVLLIMLISVVFIIPEKEKKSVYDSSEIVNYSIAIDPEEETMKNSETGEDISDSRIVYSVVDGVHTLTLTDFEFHTSKGKIIHFKADSSIDLNIVLNGSSKISDTYSAINNNNSYGIYNRYGNINISGNGALSINTSMRENIDSVRASAIYAKDGNINISSGNIVAISKGYKCRAIYASKDVIISGGTLDVYAGGYGNIKGIYGNNIYVTGGKVDIEVMSRSAKCQGMGIEETNSTGGIIDISGGKVNVDIDSRLQTIADLKKLLKITMENDDLNRGFDLDTINEYIDTIVDDESTSVKDTPTLINYLINKGGYIDKDYVISDSLNYVMGRGIEGHIINIKDRSEVNVTMKGINCKGLDAEKEDYEDEGALNILNKSKVNIKGDIYKTSISNYVSTGIYVNQSDVVIDNSDINIDLKNNKISSSVYGMCILNSSVAIQNSSKVFIEANYGKAIEMREGLLEDGVTYNPENTISVSDSYVLCQGSKRAIDFYNDNNSVVLKTHDGTSMEAIVNVATDYEGRERIVYNREDLDSYKYIEIGEVYDFTLYIDENGNIYKNSANEENKLSDELVSKLGLSTEVVDSVVNVTFNNTYFITSANTGIEFGSDAKIILKEGTTSRIASKYNNGSYDISTSGSLTIDGYGKIVLDSMYTGNIGTATKFGIYASELNINKGNIVIQGLNTADEAVGIFVFGGVNINGGNIDIIGGYMVGTIYGIDTDETDVQISGGNLDIDIDYVASDTATSKKAYGIVSTGFIGMSVDGGITSIDISGNPTTSIGIDSTYAIDLSDGTCEVAADTLLSSGIYLGYNPDVAISKAKDSNGADVESPSLDNVSSYKYARIEPNYYITYRTDLGKLYRNYSDEEIEVEGLYIDEDGNLVMDGFNFSTSVDDYTKYALYIYGSSDKDVQLIVKDYSENTLINNWVNQTDLYGIYSAGSPNMTITGNGKLNIECNVEDEGFGGYRYGIYGINSDRFTIEDTNIDIYAPNYVGNTAAGIYCTSNEFIIDNANIDVECYADSGWSRGIYSGYNLNINNSDIDIISCTEDSSDTAVGIYTATGNSTMNLYNSVVDIYAKNNLGYGVEGVKSYGNIVMEKCNLNIYAESYDSSWSAGIRSSGKTITLTDSDMDIVLNYKEARDTNYGIHTADSSGDKEFIKIDNTSVDFDVNSSSFYGICATTGDINICNGSDITLYAKGNNEVNNHKLISADINDVSISYSVLNINSNVSLDTYGIYAAGTSGVDIVSSILEMDSVSTTAVTGICTSSLTNIEDSKIVTKCKGAVCYGIKVDSAVIDDADIVIDNSDVNISLTSTNNASFGILSYNNSVDICDTSKVEIDINSTSTDTHTSIDGYEEIYDQQGIYADKNIDITESEMILNGNAVKYSGLVAYGEIGINNSVINFENISTKKETNYCMYGEDGVSITNSSDIDIHFVSSENSTYMYYGQPYYSYSQYLIESDGYMTITDSDIYINANMYYGVALSCFDANMTVTDSKIDIDAVVDDFDGLYSNYYYASDTTNVGKISVTNSTIDITTTPKTNGDNGVESEVYGLFSGCNNIELNNTEAILNMDTNFGIYGVFTYADINIMNNSVVTVESSNEYCYGIETYGGYIDITDSTVNMLNIMSDDFNGIYSYPVSLTDEEYKNDITISKSIINMLNIKQKTDASYACGILTGWGNITIEEQSNINMDFETVDMYAVSTNEDILASNSVINIAGFSHDENSYSEGIYSMQGKVNIDNCNIEMDVEMYSSMSIGTWNYLSDSIETDVIINNSSINIECGYDTASYACGIYASMRSEMSNSDIDISSNATVGIGIFSHHSFSSNDVIMNIVTSNNNKSYAIGCNEFSEENKRVYISGGYVSVRAGKNAIIGTLDTTTDTDFGVVMASTEYDGSVIVDYNESNLSTYKYIVIGPVEDYAYKYYPSSGTIYAADSEVALDTDELTELGVSIIDDGTTNVLLMNYMNINTDKEVALWILGDTYIQLNEGSVNSLVSNGDTKSNYYGIKSTGNLNISGMGTLNLNKQSASVNDENYYGIYSDKNILIEEDKVNLTVDKMKIIASNSATTGSTYGIYGENVGFKCANVSIQINEDNTTSVGVYADSNGIEDAGKIYVNDGGVEIKADKVTNVVPTYTNVGITGATNSNGSNVWPGVVNNTPSYKYVLIQPNYFLNYNSSNGKLYRSNTGTEANIAGWRTDTSTGTNVLVIDGLNFETTAQYGISFSGGNTLTIADGSENRIFINHFVVEAVHGINVNGAGKISGLGELTININNNIPGAKNRSQYVKGIVFTGKMEIYDCKLNIDVISNDYKAANIYSNTSIYISGTELDLKAKSPGLNYNIYAFNDAAGNVKILSTTIKSSIEGPDTNAVVKGLETVHLEDVEIDAVCIGEEALHYGFASDTGGTIKDSTLRFKNDGGYTYMISNWSEKLVIDNSKVYLDIDTEKWNCSGICNYDDLDIINNSYVEFVTNAVNPSYYRCSDTSCNIAHYNGHEFIYNIGNVNIEDSCLKVNAVTTQLAVIYGYGMIGIDNSTCDIKFEQVAVDQTLTDTRESDGLLALDGDLNIFNKSTVNLDMSGDKIFCLYSENNVNIDDAEVDIKGKSGIVLSVDSYGGNITIDESDIDTSQVTARGYYGLTTAQHELTDEDIANGETYKGDITITGSKLNLSAKKQGNESYGHGIKSMYGSIFINKDSDSDKNNDIDINLDMRDISSIHTHQSVTVNNGQIDINTTSTEEESYGHGICSGTGATISGADTVVNMNISSVMDTVGIDSYSGNVNILNGAEVNINAKSDTTAKGIWTDTDEGSVNITSSKVNVYAGKNTADAIAIDTKNLVVSGTSKEKETVILETSKVYKNISSETYSEDELIMYPGKNDSSYKYVKIGDVSAYYYKFNVDDGSLSKVYTDGTSSITTLPTGCSVTTNTLGQYVLQLNNFEFLTTAPVAISLATLSNNVNAVGNIEFIGKNNITLLESNGTYNLDFDGDGQVDTSRYGITAENIKEMNINGEGTYSFEPINRVNEEVMQGGIISKSKINISLDKYIVKTKAAYAVYGIAADGELIIENTTIDMDVDNMYGAMLICSGSDTSVKGATITVQDKDTSNENILNTTCIFESEDNLVISESSNITADIDPMEIGFGTMVTNICNIDNSYVYMNISNGFELMGIIAQKSIFNESILDINIEPDADYGAGAGLYSESVSDVNSTIDINIQNGASIMGIMCTNGIEEQVEDENPTILNMQNTKLTIDVESSSNTSQARGISVMSASATQENDSSFTLKLIGNSVFNGGTLNINCKAAIASGIIGIEDKLTITNMEDVKIHSYTTDTSYLEAMKEMLEEELKELEASGVYTPEMINIMKLMYAGGYGNALFTANLEIDNSKAKIISNVDKAIVVTDNCDINGYVEASETYGTFDNEPADMRVVSDFNTTSELYKYVVIDTTVISVDITWGALDYVFNPGTWNTDTLVYDNRGWEPKAEGGDEIAITNTIDSNVPINASVSYNQAEGYTAITGDIVIDKTSKNKVPESNNMLVGSQLKTYLILSGELGKDAKIKDQVIGNVTVILGEAM